MQAIELRGFGAERTLVTREEFLAAGGTGSDVVSLLAAGEYGAVLRAVPWYAWIITTGAAIGLGYLVFKKKRR